MGSPGTVAMAVMLATFMEVLDTTVVNVSLPHIAGTLAAGVEESTWVLTSYLVSNAIVLPATGWLSSIFGRKRYYMASVAIFALSSLMCGLAPSLTALIVFRVLQGLGGGALQPISQAILLECYPRRHRGIGMAIFGIGVVFAPIIGPTLGGWLTDNYSWRWIFYINLPISVLSLVMAQIYVVDPPYLQRGLISLDYIGLGLLALGIGTLQVVLDTGQRHDWFGTTWVAELAVVSAVSLIALVIWEWYTRNPVIDLSIFRIRNIAAGMFLIFMVGVALYASGVLQPLFVQTLLGYTAMLSGLVMSPGGFGTLFFMPIVGRIVGRVDPRPLITIGFLMAGMSLFMMSHFNLQISFWQAAYPRIVLGVGLAFLFVPLSTVTFAFVPGEKTGTATGIFNLMRNIGGSFGIAGVQTLLATRQQFHQDRLVAFISPLSQGFQAWQQSTIAQLTAAGQPPLRAQAEAVAIANQTVLTQASLMAFVDAFWVSGVIMFGLIPLVFILRRPARHPAAAQQPPRG
ncbi:MAG TPA: DHA2 family efflux MFS transporter permease subunit [Armatimonadota bacterium]|nr:DHA2 family efflux MFS transporter permease subunit [Armatimonadota bacterium]